jgi:hypothetical protein
MLRYWIASLLTVFVLAAAASDACAIGDRSPNCAPWINGAPWFSVDLSGARAQPLPTFQAAPWYLYWPYDGHFQTPAPVYAPPTVPPGYYLPYNPYNPGMTNVQPGPWMQRWQSTGYGH